MRVLMLGWEFPPAISGGLGTACYGLTRALSQAGAEITFILPRSPKRGADHLKLVGVAAACQTDPTPHQPWKHGATTAAGATSQSLHVPPAGRPIKVVPVASPLQPYLTPAVFAKRVQGRGLAGSSPGAADTRTSKEHAKDRAAGDASDAIYAGDLFDQVQRYASLASAAAADHHFDVIHAHDWMSFPAGAAISLASGRPFVAHVHSTEFDRGGTHLDQRIYDIEREGMHRAAKVIAVSYLTRGVILSRYGVDPQRIAVVYNALDWDWPLQGDAATGPAPLTVAGDEKVVLFLGRVTMQKGPEYFLAAARKVLTVYPKVRFVMAGSGDMVSRSMQLAAEFGIADRVLFTGFLNGKDVERVFRSADLYVMPSVSEPFGIASLEAISCDVPVLVSRQSGVSEVLRHVLKVDFWDIDEMANKIIAVLRHPPLHATLKTQAGFEVRNLTWSDAARRCLDVYHEVLAPRSDAQSSAEVTAVATAPAPARMAPPVAIPPAAKPAGRRSPKAGRQPASAALGAPPARRTRPAQRKSRSR